ncbi:DUF2510 domain-containing protein [Microbacterium sp.]|uniref:DUF2510 domain-containing protein n=1 Tax=Microbacterium sp. TaxID=51671 RepID=UPI003F94C54C
MSEQLPSGWHPDPIKSERLRYWDGTTWTDSTVGLDTPGLVHGTRPLSKSSGLDETKRRGYDCSQVRLQLSPGRRAWHHLLLGQ